jgi:hypothetical protein
MFEFCPFVITMQPEESEEYLWAEAREGYEAWVRETEDTPEFFAAMDAETERRMLAAEQGA